MYFYVNNICILKYIPYILKFHIKEPKASSNAGPSYLQIIFIKHIFVAVLVKILHQGHNTKLAFECWPEEKLLPYNMQTLHLVEEDHATKKIK